MQIFENLKLDVYCIPASPSETNITLSIRFHNLSDIPNILIIAEQPNGQHYSNSYTYLNSQGYTILTFRIDDVKGSGDWERFDDTNKQSKLANRANEINRDLRQFFKNNSII